MKMIRPIVNASKIIDPFDAVIVGFNGVLTEGNGIKQDAINALINMKKAGKSVVLCSNSPLRVSQIADILYENKEPLNVFDGIVSAGEILHYKLKNKSGEFSQLSKCYFQLGSKKNSAVFAHLDYERVADLGSADFVYMESVENLDDVIEKYLPDLQQAVALNLPFVAAGNDTSSFKDGKICIAPGAIAEQYAVLGGKIITLGKPDPIITAYCLEALPQNLAKEKILVIGDNIATDIKGANLAGLSSILVSKGVHVNFLGEGYISDVAKTRELALSLDAYPDFVISNLRW